MQHHNRARNIRLLTTLLLIGATSLAAPAGAFELGLNALSVLPRGQLDENLDAGYGLGLQVMVPLGEGPFAIGAELAVARYAEERRPFFEDLDVVTGNDIGMFNAVLRAQAPSGKVRPYADAVLGIKVFQTESTLVRDCTLFCDDEESFDPDVELYDTAFSYGVGAGLQVELFESNFFIDAGFRYTRGRDAVYLTRGSISDDNLDERLRESRTDSWSIHLGFALKL